MDSQLPTWFPLVLTLFQFLTVLLILFIGLFLKGLKGDLSENTKETKHLKDAVHVLEVLVVGQYVKREEFNSLRNTVTSQGEKLTPLHAEWVSGHKRRESDR